MSFLGHVLGGSLEGLGVGMARQGEADAREREREEARQHQYDMTLLQDKLATARAERGYEVAAEAATTAFGRQQQLAETAFGRQQQLATTAFGRQQQLAETLYERQQEHARIRREHELAMEAARKADRIAEANRADERAVEAARLANERAVALANQEAKAREDLAKLRDRLARERADEDRTEQDKAAEQARERQLRDRWNFDVPWRTEQVDKALDNLVPSTIEMTVTEVKEKPGYDEDTGKNIIVRETTKVPRKVRRESFEGLARSALEFGPFEHGIGTREQMNAWYKAYTEDGTDLSRIAESIRQISEQELLAPEDVIRVLGRHLRLRIPREQREQLLEILEPEPPAPGETPTAPTGAGAEQPGVSEPNEGVWSAAGSYLQPGDNTGAAAFDRAMERGDYASADIAGGIADIARGVARTQTPPEGMTGAAAFDWSAARPGAGAAPPADTGETTARGRPVGGDSHLDIMLRSLGAGSSVPAAAPEAAPSVPASERFGGAAWPADRMVPADDAPAPAVAPAAGPRPHEGFLAQATQEEPGWAERVRDFMSGVGAVGRTAEEPAPEIVQPDLPTFERLAGKVQQLGPDAAQMVEDIGAGGGGGRGAWQTLYGALSEVAAEAGQVMPQDPYGIIREFSRWYVTGAGRGPSPQAGFLAQAAPPTPPVAPVAPQEVAPPPPDAAPAPVVPGGGAGEVGWEDIPDASRRQMLAGRSAYEGGATTQAAPQAAPQEAIGATAGVVQPDAQTFGRLAAKIQELGPDVVQMVEGAAQGAAGPTEGWRMLYGALSEVAAEAGQAMPENPHGIIQEFIRWYAPDERRSAARGPRPHEGFLAQAVPAPTEEGTSWGTIPDARRRQLLGERGAYEGGATAWAIPQAPAAPAPGSQPAPEPAQPDARTFEGLATTVQRLGPQAARAVEGIAEGTGTVEDWRILYGALNEWAASTGRAVPQDPYDILQEFAQWYVGEGSAAPPDPSFLGQATGTPPWPRSAQNPAPF